MVYSKHTTTSFCGVGVFACELGLQQGRVCQEAALRRFRRSSTACMLTPQMWLHQKRPAVACEVLVSWKAQCRKQRGVTWSSLGWSDLPCLGHLRP